MAFSQYTFRYRKHFYFLLYFISFSNETDADSVNSQHRLYIRENGRFRFVKIPSALINAG